MKKVIRAILAAMTLPLAAEVTITEFMADNESTLPTRANTYEDWIELHNDGAEPVDLAGWRIGVSKKISSGKGWTFPSNTVIAAGAYLLVYADKLNCVTNGELHTDFKLSKTGNDDHLWLVDAAGVVKSDFGAYPQQLEDVSCGIGHQRTTLISSSTPMTYTINGTSHPGRGRIGFTSATSVGFTCTRYWMNATVDSVNTAKNYVNNSGRWREQPVTQTYDYIAFFDNSSTGSFSAQHFPCPGWTSTTSDHDNFVVVATSEIYVPEAGTWTFAIGSDDGFQLTITGNGVNYSMDAGSRSFTESTMVCEMPVAGVYSVNLIWYEQGGGAGCEFSAAKGSRSSFDTTNFKLVGASDSPLKHAGALTNYIDTDIGSAMRNNSTRVTAEWTFNRGDLPAEGDSAYLELRYADACCIYLNDHPVSMLNLNQSESGAQSKRPSQEATQMVSVPIPVSYFRSGVNKLTLVGFNDTISDGDFLLAPELVYLDGAGTLAYFKVPTPGAANTSQGFSGPTPFVRASEPRGYKTSAFNVELSCPELPDAPIYYTLDGTEPTVDHGTRYTGPIRVSSTTFLRAMAPDPTSVLERSTTFTWLFMSDILTQSSSTPAGWPASGAVNGHTMKYGLNASTLSGDRTRFINGITNAEHVATLSLVTDLSNLFGVGTGIYSYPGNQGRGWERPVSIECIDPVHGTNNEFQINAGLRIRGAASRGTGNPKHSFHVFFREEYGTASRLNFPIFGDEGADSFKKFDLRSEQNHSWHSAGGEHRNTLVRDVFSRDSQRDLGETAYGRSRYYHVYINGQYWGIYQTEERPEENFGESYFDTDKTQWDVVKKNHDRQLECTNGSLDAYNELFTIAMSQGFSGSYSNNYWKVQGLNPDGSTNATYRPLLNIDNLINYVLITHLTVDPDSPISEWSDFSNNINMLYDQTGANRGFFWMHHDSEHGLGAYQGIADGTYGYGKNMFDWGTSRDSSAFNNRENMNPLGIHDKLSAHPLYKRRFADLVQRAFFNNGALTVANSKARVQSRMDELDEAVVGEAVRWGGGSNTRSNWLTACADVLTFLEMRHPILISQYRSKGWFPSVDAPFASLANGSSAPLGTTLTLAAGQTFYYTTDGTDPMDANGNPSATAIKVEAEEGSAPPAPRTLFDKRSVWTYYDWGSLPPNDASGRAWNATDFTEPSNWGQGPGILGVYGNNGTAVGTATSRYVNHGTSGTQVTTTYFRRTFELSAKEASATSLAMTMLFDDGYVLYINGTEVDRLYINAGTVTYDTFANTTIGTSGTYTQNSYANRTLTIPQGVLREGVNVVAVEVHQIHSTSTDMYWDCSLATTAASFTSAANVTTSFPLRGDGVQLKARALNGSTWSALSDLSFTTTPPVQDLSVLKLAELMHAPNKADNIDPYDEDDLAWIELYNAGETTLNLYGCTLEGEKFSLTFGDFEFAGTNRMIVAGSVEGFRTAHPSVTCPVVEWPKGSIKRKGDTIKLSAPDGTVLSLVTFDNTWFNGGSYNTGRSLVVRDFAFDQTADEFSTEADWMIGSLYGGTPGGKELPRFTSIGFDDSGVPRKYVFTVENLDGPFTFSYSTNLQSVGGGWINLGSARYKLEGDTIIVTPLKMGNTSPLYNNTPRAFFRIQTDPK